MFKGCFWILETILSCYSDPFWGNPQVSSFEWRIEHETIVAEGLAGSNVNCCLTTVGKGGIYIPYKCPLAGTTVEKQGES